MKKLFVAALALVATLSFLPAVEAAQVAVRGTLVLASNQGNGIDPALKKYSGQLKRLGFKSYKVIGGGATRVNAPGEGRINLGGGFVTQIAIKGSSPRPVSMRLMKGNKNLAGVTGNLPLLVGGPRHQNGKLVLILDGR